MIKATGFEKAIITSWESWDGDQEFLQFNNCTLTSEISENLGKETVGSICLNLAKNSITIYDDLVEGNYTYEKTFKLQLTMAEEING